MNAPRKEQESHRELLNGFELDARRDIEGELIGISRPCFSDIDDDNQSSQTYWAHRGLLVSQVGPGELL